MTADNNQPISPAQGEQMVEAAFRKLLNTYMNSNHRKKEDLITKAFLFAKEAHKGVKRLSGEPYIMHPIAVAQIACEEMGLGSTSICAALLHDVVEDTDYTTEDIENIFGKKIADIIDGLTKISGGIFGDRASAQAENFKKLLLTMSDDIRVILIKICDRLHNMRTLENQPPNKQYKIAGETLYIYAPLANRLGLNKIKTELENLSFKFEHPEQYQAIEEKLAATSDKRDILFQQFTDPIKKELDRMGLKYTIKARIKSPYSIWHKMQTKHLTFDEIYDLLAVRIIFTPKDRAEEINESFKIYVSISKIYKSHPDRLRDWVNHPKANGYQALHVTLMSHLGKWVEVQIRSDRMDEIAEQGFAAHWKYKEGTEISEEEGELNNWLRTIKEILDDPQPDAMDFLDAIKLNLFASEIFVFTPKGEIKTLPAGCTALDFAFQIHTFLGSHCIGAKVNYKLVPLSHKLQSGDQVEILTSKSQHVEPEWINFVSTAKAKAKIQAILKRGKRELQKKGEAIFTQWLHEHQLEINPAIIDKLSEIHHVDGYEQLLQAIGEQTVKLTEAQIGILSGERRKDKERGWRRYVPFLDHGKKITVVNSESGLLIVGKDFDKKKPCIISENTINKYIKPQCCHPIPGDDILGYIDHEGRIELHNRACAVANRLKSSYGNRILDAKWDMHKLMLFDAEIKIKGIDRKKMMLDLVQVISTNFDIYIRDISISSDDGLFEGNIKLKVHDRDEVRQIIDGIKQIEDVHEALQVL